MICRACNETLNETNRANITWCIDSGVNTLCGNSSEIFQDDNNGFPEVNITPDGNVLITIARQAYHGRRFICQRQCSDRQSQEQVITLSIESTLHNICPYNIV